MKLSTAPRHFAPVMRVRDISGKLVKRTYFTRSNHPGRHWAKPIVKPSDNEMLIKGEQNLVNDPVAVKKELGIFRRILSRLRGDR